MGIYFTDGMVQIINLGGVDYQPYPTEDQIIFMVRSQTYYNWTGNLQSTVIPTVDYPVNICFPSGTPITTDQGLISIEKIEKTHTIRNKKIIDVSRTFSNDKYLICFEKDALDINVPSKNTMCSKNHRIFYKGKMFTAKTFLGFENVKKVKYTGEILYNVLMESHDTMLVNNMICETLHPQNDIAKILRN